MRLTSNDFLHARRQTGNCCDRSLTVRHHTCARSICSPARDPWLTLIGRTTSQNPSNPQARSTGPKQHNIDATRSVLWPDPSHRERFVQKRCNVRAVCDVCSGLTAGYTSTHDCLPTLRPSCHSIYLFKSANMSSNQWDVCTFATCSIKQSIFQYRPSLAANSVFIALFGLSLIIHVFQGVLYKQKTFAILMSLGCICEMIGYGGRILMWKDPWGFNGFIIQIGRFSYYLCPPSPC